MDISDAEREIIEAKIRENQLLYQKRERSEFFNKMMTIFEVLPHITKEEARKALDMNSGDEEESIEILSNFDSLRHIRIEIAKDYETEKEIKDMKIEEIDEDSYEDIQDSYDLEEYEYRQKRKPHKKKRVKKLRLDDAIAQGNMKGWSDARIRAWNCRFTNPNAYYYRFNPPNEEQKNGKWSKEEKALFFKRMQEIGVQGQWGIFSMGIPGRVGYQCANFYRYLIETGEIKDDRYVIGRDGKAHMRSNLLNSNKRKTQKKTRAITNTKKRKRKSEKNSDDDDEEYCVSPSIKEKIEKEVEEYQLMRSQANPLPGFIDAITNEEVVDPAMSPSGRVLSYSTWVKVLSQEPKNTCPFTKQPLKKRDLIHLTWENIDKYRSMIIHPV